MKKVLIRVKKEVVELKYFLVWVLVMSSLIGGFSLLFHVFFVR